MKNSFTRNNLHSLLFCCSAVLLNIVYYLFLIQRHQYFLTDDFLNFGIISSNYSNFISLDLSNISSYEKFYFVTRPLTYLLSLFELKIFSYHSELMKIFSLLLHSTLLISLYLLIKQLSLFFKVELNGVALFISLILFGLHPNNMWWIYWISDQNELLMILFYTLSIYSAISYLNSMNRKYLYFYLLFYILSIITKQEGLNLPVIILIFIYYFKDRISFEKYKALKNYSLAGVVILISYSVFTYLFSANNIKFEYLLKKPFSLAGNLLLVLFPLNSLSNYEYFVEHKMLAFIIGTSFTILAVLLIITKKISLKPILFAILLVVVSFYPRIFDVANNRINTIQVLSFSIAVYAIISLKSKFRNYYIAGMAVLIVLNCFEIKSVTTYYESLKEMQYSQASEYSEHLNENKISVISFWAHLLPYQTYFLKNHSFGKDELRMLPLSYGTLNSGKSFVPDQKIECTFRKDAIDLRNVEDPEVRIDIDNFNKESIVYKYLQNDINYDKGFKEFTFPLNDKYKNDKFIYFNGLKWISLN